MMRQGIGRTGEVTLRVRLWVVPVKRERRVVLPKPGMKEVG